MIGPILVFLSVCALVAIFMAIVRSFLRASEEVEPTIAEEKVAEERKSLDPEPASPKPSPPRQPQWAH